MPRKIKIKKNIHNSSKNSNGQTKKKRPGREILPKNKKREPVKQTRKKLSTPVHKNLFVKPEENPIISPKKENGWESWQTFNPGVILLHEKIHFLYRAMGEDGVSRLGYAASPDGLHIEERLAKPAYIHEFQERSF